MAELAGCQRSAEADELPIGLEASGAKLLADCSERERFVIVLCLRRWQAPATTHRLRYRPNFFAAHRFLSAATMAALPSALNFRLGFPALADATLDPAFFAAHRFR